MTCAICSSPDHSRSNCPMRCTHCHRTLHREPVQVDGRSYGPTCARNLFGRTTPSGRTYQGCQPRQVWRTNVVRDRMTLELFA